MTRSTLVGNRCLLARRGLVWRPVRIKRLVGSTGVVGIKLSLFPMILSMPVLMMWRAHLDALWRVPSLSPCLAGVSFPRVPDCAIYHRP